MAKNLPASTGDAREPTLGFLPGEFQGQRSWSLAGYSPGGHGLVTDTHTGLSQA